MSYRGEDMERANVDSTVRVFARPLKFDVACPKCDYVAHIQPSTNRRVWDPRTARWQCMGCFAVYHVGLVLWKASRGRYSTPGDQTPTVKQALELRRYLSRYAQTKLMRGRDTNVVFEKLPEVSELVKK